MFAVSLLFKVFHMPVNSYLLRLTIHVVEGNATRVDATTIYTIDAHKRTRSQEIELELKKS